MEKSKSKFIRMVDGLAEYEIEGEEAGKEKVFDANGKECKGEKIERRKTDEK